MNIFSFSFIGLTLITFIILFILSKIIKKDDKLIKISNIILLISSYVFITYIDYRFTLILLSISFIAWYCGKNIKYNKIGIILCILSLAFFKYTNFFIDSFNNLFKTDINALKIILPIGISFYTFSAISYIVDIKRKKNNKS